MEEITIPMEEYKELLIIKGKYEEIRRIQKPLILYDGYTENKTTIIPLEDRTNDPIIKPPYKVNCSIRRRKYGKRISKIFNNISNS